MKHFFQWKVFEGIMPVFQYHLVFLRFDHSIKYILLSSNFCTYSLLLLSTHVILTYDQDHDMWLGHDGCGDLSLSCKIWTIIMWLLLFSHELVFTRDYPVAAACPCPGLIIRLTRWCFQGNHQESITITITSSEPILMSDSYLIRSEDWIKKESIHVCCKTTTVLTVKITPWIRLLMF